jgi:NadR type nicotinamide-nucleotide adenylyltransferase
MSVIRIEITGPESSGKTTLAKRLAENFNSIWVSEYSRIYFEEFGPGYQYEDFCRIVEGQLSREKYSEMNNPPVVFLDTSMLVLKIWGMRKWGKVPLIVDQLLEKKNYNLYLLCYPDLDWEPDPLRENPFDREKLFEEYEEVIKIHGLDYRIIKGHGDERERNAIEEVTQFLRKV